MAPGRGGLRSRAQEVSLSLRQLSPACCGRRLPRRRQSPARSRRAVGCMSSSRLYSPPPPPPVPPSSPPAAVTVPACKLLAGNKRLRSGRAGASPPPSRRAARPARPLLAGSVRLAGGSLPLPAPPRRAAPPGQPPWKPGSAKRRAQGRRAEAEPRRRQGKGATRAEREGAAERIGDRGTEGGASARFWARTPGARLSKPTPPRIPRAPRPEGKPRPRESERKGAALRESRPRRANPLTKESPALLLPVRPPVAPVGSQPAGLSSQFKGEQTQKGLFCLLQLPGSLVRATRGPICRQGRAGCSGPPALLCSQRLPESLQCHL